MAVGGSEAEMGPTATTEHDLGLRAALERAAGTDIFFIPKAHFAEETPQREDERWWYYVQLAIWCRQGVPKIWRA